MTSCPRCFRARSSQRRSAAATSRGAASARGRVGWLTAACVAARHPFLFYEDMELCLRARDLGVPTILRPDIRLRHLGGTSTERALGSGALELHARRRREVVAGRGRLALAIDDASEAATFGLRAGARRIAGRGGELERARLRALREARRSR
jgi:N-acetylglucosaminyl-diphospho-decaprenol L-rhamnosyltransferase